MTATAQFEPLTSYVEYPVDEMRQRAADFYAEMRRRRTVRAFSSRAVPRDIIENCIMTAGTAPNGANMQPWQFVVVSDPEVKHQIRLGAEEVEREFYNERASQDWLEALAPLGTDANKPFLDTAPYLIVVFAQTYGVLPNGSRVKNYYVNESVGIATGFLISALHHAGLATMTHTPSPMAFLNTILGRPANERPFVLMVTGYPAEDVEVPVITKKPMSSIATFIE